MAELRISVAGMTCPTCEESIQRAVGRVAGVRSVSADHTSGSVVVAVDGSPPEKAVREAIEEAGYDLVEAGPTR